MELVNRPNSNKDIYRNNIGRDIRFVLANRAAFWLFWFSSLGASQHLALRTEYGHHMLYIFLEQSQFKTLTHVVPLNACISKTLDSYLQFRKMVIAATEVCVRQGESVDHRKMEQVINQRKIKAGRVLSFSLYNMLPSHLIPNAGLALFLQEPGGLGPIKCVWTSRAIFRRGQPHSV